MAALAAGEEQEVVLMMACVVSKHFGCLWASAAVLLHKS